jgi:hypothetical protein
LNPDPIFESGSRGKKQKEMKKKKCTFETTAKIIYIL